MSTRSEVRRRVTVFPMTGRQLSFLYVPHRVCEECDLTVRLVRRIAKVATDVMFADVRHFDPEDDGYWDGHRYDIDEAFPEVAGLVAAHRISNALAVRA